MNGNGERITMPWWAWGVSGGVFLLLLGGTVTAANWVAGTLLDHSTQLENHDVRIAVVEKTGDRINEKLDRILEELRNK